MEIRYGTHPQAFAHCTTAEIRDEFLIENLFQPDQLVCVYSHIDRMIVLGCLPVTQELHLEQGMDVWACLGTHTFLERRELGVFNLGGNGSIVADGVTYHMGHKDCLYVAMGTQNVVFSSENKEEPAKFYLVSAPAHRACKTTFISIQNAAARKLGGADNANTRTIYQFIHPDVLETCQLTMGMTSLEPGNVWNTMPCHTHERRMEVYLYTDVAPENVVFHFMGQPQETRHLVIQNQQAVISPSWSIHSACATSNYSFIWAMGGENQAFDDMDAIPTTALR